METKNIKFNILWYTSWLKENFFLKIFIYFSFGLHSNNFIFFGGKQPIFLYNNPFQNDEIIICHSCGGSTGAYNVAFS
jgi:hypothetical protein